MADRTAREAKRDAGENDRLKGTFASVLILGGIMLVLWIVIFAIYLYR